MVCQIVADRIRAEKFPVLVDESCPLFLKPVFFGLGRIGDFGIVGPVVPDDLILSRNGFANRFQLGLVLLELSFMVGLEFLDHGGRVAFDLARRVVDGDAKFTISLTHLLDEADGLFPLKVGQFFPGCKFRKGLCRGIGFPAILIGE